MDAAKQRGGLDEWQDTLERWRVWPLRVGVLPPAARLCHALPHEALQRRRLRSRRKAGGAPTPTPTPALALALTLTPCYPDQ